AGRMERHEGAAPILGERDMKRQSTPEKDADAVDKIEEFFKTSFGKIEDAVKKEIREFKEKRRMPEDHEHRVFSYLDAFLRDKNVATVPRSRKAVEKEVIKAVNHKGGETVVE